jgi:alpha-beta hydrolase superfamily lysophospholipase
MIAMRRMRSTILLILTVLPWFLAGCTTEIVPPGPPVMRPEETADAFVMPDGYRLPFRAWVPAGRPRAVMLALHGMNDSRDAWEIPGPELAAAGIAVYAPDQRGFGATATRGLWPGTEGLVDDARVMANLLHQRNPGIPLYLMGESMGAATLMILATRPSPPDVAGYILSAPAVWSRSEMNIFMRSALWIATRTIPGFVMVNRGFVKITASDNHEALVRLSTDPLTLRGTRVDAVNGLVNLMDAASVAAPAMRSRALFLYGGQDQLVPKRATRAVWRALADPGAVRAYYPPRYHLALRDLGRATVIGDILAWIQAPTAPLPSGADRAAAEWLNGGEESDTESTK